MAPTLKLTYFDIRARAESIRLALTIAGIPFEDVRLPRSEWPAFKEKTPYGQVPTLEITENGQTFMAAQSEAILRYVARLAPESGLYPVEDPLKALRVDEILNACEDLGKKISPTMREPDAEKKVKTRQELTGPEGELTVFTKKINARLDPSGYVLGGDKPTIADLELNGAMWWMSSGLLDGVDPAWVNQFDRICKLRDKLAAHPKVKEWYSKK
ncbi:putative glutathione S-transferase [Fimicolochytrium jonesii]|uniref:putative glutathione S-transferase n=1 Tax=Fimicolochytrium jonesii TaxID=1396493 RepID=UPI0022FEC1CF|nr:putative glutathione S-transferase [Fimicolochytrium jonesii]KAI8824297.1 putative glutathione S-transferase [Fimicolochytrium jonesii]